MKGKEVCDKVLSRREILKHGLYSGLTASLTPSLWLSGCGGGKGRKDKVNVILISIDTLRADHVGCYGYERNTSPNIDSFANDSLFFENAYSPWPTTVPALNSIMTGALISNERIKDITSYYFNATYLAEILRNKGYYTAGFTDHYALGTKNKRFGKEWYVIQKGLDTFQNFGKGHKDVTSHILTENVINWLDRNHKNKFFLWVHYFDPHHNYAPLPKYEGLFGYSIIRSYGRIYNPMDILEIRKIEKSLTKKEIECLKCLYDSEIFYTDMCIGKVFDIIKELNLWENTVIIITADHGEEFRERIRIGHGTSVYNEVIRVPLIIKIPNRAPAKIKANIATQEIFNIVLNLASKKEIEFNDEDIISRTHPSGRELKANLNDFTIVSGNYKYIYNPETRNEEFYYLQKDVTEKNNLLADSTYEAKKLELKQKLKSWMFKNNAGVQAPSKEALKSEEELNRRLRSLGYVR